MLLIGIFLLITGAVGLIIFFPGLRHGMMDGMMGTGQERRYASAGERIYQAGIGSDGRPIKNSHGMEGVGCAMCHGREGQVMRMMMMEVPPLKWDYLSDPEGHNHPGRSHPLFNEAAFQGLHFGRERPCREYIERHDAEVGDERRRHGQLDRISEIPRQGMSQRRFI